MKGRHRRRAHLHVTAVLYEILKVFAHFVPAQEKTETERDKLKKRDSTDDSELNETRDAKQRQEQNTQVSKHCVAPSRSPFICICAVA